MALPTDAQSMTAPQLTAAAVPGTGTIATPVSVGDHTAATFTIYNKAGVWRCAVMLPNGQPGGMQADFKMTDIVAPSDDAPTMMKRLFVAAKIQLGLS